MRSTLPSVSSYWGHWCMIVLVLILIYTSLTVNYSYLRIIRLTKRNRLSDEMPFSTTSLDKFIITITIHGMGLSTWRVLVGITIKVEYSASISILNMVPASMLTLRLTYREIFISSTKHNHPNRVKHHSRYLLTILLRLYHCKELCRSP